MRTSWRRVLKILGVCLVLYVGSYFAISRYLWSKYRALDSNGFYYATPRMLYLSRSGEACHIYLYHFYWPVWAADYYLLGGPLACQSLPMFELD